MKTFLLGVVATFMSLSIFDCNARLSKLPEEIPEKVEINFRKKLGMTNAGTNIKISNQTIQVEEKKANETKSDQWSAQIKKDEQEKLYRIFVENKFDTVANDKSELFTSDAGSESISIDLGNGEKYDKSYGVNEPLSGDSLQRYQAVSGVIQELWKKYENKTAMQTDADVAILSFDSNLAKYLSKNGTPTDLSADEIAQSKEIIKKAVDEQNAKQKNAYRLIKLVGYKYQLSPFLNEKGEKEVWINSFCEARENWKTQIITVEDGGSCYFNLFINLTQNSYTKFYVNGEA